MNTIHCTCPQLMPIARKCTASCRHSQLTPDRSRNRTRAAAATPIQLLETECQIPAAEAQRLLAQSCPNLSPERAQASISELLNLYKLEEVQKLVKSSPAVLALPVSDWHGFFEGYGLTKEALWKCLRYSTTHLAASDMYTAGAAIRWLKQLGPWTDAEICSRLIPCYPEVLATSTDALQQLAEGLTSLGLDAEQVQQLLFEFPGMLSAFRDENMPLIARMIESRRQKYTLGGSYID